MNGTADEGIARLGTALADLAGATLDELCDRLLGRLHPGALQDDVALVALRLHCRHPPGRLSARHACSARPTAG